MVNDGGGGVGGRAAVVEFSPDKWSEKKGDVGGCVCRRRERNREVE